MEWCSRQNCWSIFKDFGIEILKEIGNQRSEIDKQRFECPAALFDHLIGAAYIWYCGSSNQQTEKSKSS